MRHIVIVENGSMLTVLRSPDGRLEAAVEWWLVNTLGLTDWQTGTHVWVEQLEVSEGVDSTYILKQIIVKIADMVPQAKSGYWYRLDRNKRPHEYTRQQLVEYAHREEVGV